MPLRLDAQQPVQVHGKLRSAYRLGKAADDGAAGQLGFAGTLAGRAQLHQPALADFGGPGDRSGQLQQSFAGQGAVEQYQGDGILFPAGQAQPLEGLGSACRLIDAQSQGGHGFDQHEAGRRMVVNHQDPRLREVGPQGCRRLRPGSPESHGQGNSEDRAVAHFTGKTDLSLHHLDKLPDNGQTEARSAKTAGGGIIGLGKGLENALLRLLVDTDAGIGHLDLQLHRLIRCLLSPQPHNHLAAFGELDRIAEQIQQDLPQPPGIPHQAPGEIGGDMADQFHPLCRGFGRQQLHGLFHRGPRIEIDLFQ